MSESEHELDPEAHHAHEVRLYLTIFGALAFLTLLTVGVSYMHLPHAPGVVLALLIAVAKMFLIASFFMHLRHEGHLINISLAVVLGLVLILIVFVLPDLGVHEIEKLEQERAAKENPYVQMHEAGSMEHGGAVEHGGEQSH